jgi:hypothetical protein
MRTSRVGRWPMVVAVLAVSATWAQAQQPKAQTATQFYTDYRVAFDKATKVEDLLPYMASANRKQVEATPTGDREKMFGLMKMMGALTDVKVTKEEHTADGGAVLTAEAVNPDKKKTSGKITIIKESGAWKLGKEEWSS